MKRFLTFIALGLMLTTSLLTPLTSAHSSKVPVDPGTTTPEEVNEYLTNKCNDHLPFRDVDKDDWYQNAVCNLYRINAIDKADYYYPNHYMTRMEFLKLLMESEGIEPRHISGLGFKDMNSSHWAYQYALVALDMEIMVGWDGFIRPNDYITRAEALVTMERLHNQERWGWDQSDIPFWDVDAKNDAWYAWAAILGYEQGLIKGYEDGSFRGENAITRAEGAEVTTISAQIWPNRRYTAQFAN